MLLPMLLNKLNATAGLTYRFAKLAFKLQYASNPLAVMEKFAIFIVGDINEKKNLALAWFAVSLVAGKVINQRRSKAANQQVLDADSNRNKVSNACNAHAARQPS